METKEKTTRRLRPLLPLLPPVLLSLLFYLFRGRQALMDGWVIHVMAPAEQLLGRLSAPLPFSLAEVLVTVFLTACALCLIRGTVLAVRLHAPHELGRRLVCLLCALLWVWTGYCWLWSAGYYSASFAEKSGLETRPYTVSTLAQVTLYFACQAADLSTQMVRDSEGHFAEDLDDCFRRGVSVYEELEQKLSEAAAEIITTQENDKYQAFGRQWVKKIGQECQKENIPRKDLAEQVKAYIIENLKEELRVETIAKKFYLSSDYLTKIFKKETGVSISDFILEERMFLAKELIQAGQMSISRVSYECGYDNYSYFTKLFKKKYGVTPREYSQNVEK